MTSDVGAVVVSTVMLALLVAVLVFAILRFSGAARRGSRRPEVEGAEGTFVAAALQDALGRLREQERATQARAEASERLSSEIIASMTSGLLVVGAVGEVRTLNPAARRLLSIVDDTVRGSFRERLAGAPALVRVIDECLATGQAIVRRAVEVRLPGSETPTTSHLGVTVSPIGDSEGRLQGAICLFTDLTAIVELEEQLRLKESLARLGELTAGIAHEFRNGLATIHGYGRLLDPDKVSPDYRPYVLGIRQETQALGEMVANFLNFAKPTALNVAPVDLRALVERAAEEIRSEVRALGGGVESRGEFPTIEGDEVLLRQALSNLCRNALEACAEARIVPRITLEGMLDDRPGWTRIRVMDNGPGIDPSAHDRIFRPFFTTRPKGIGLGLALVQKIIVTHSGRVTADPRPEGGTSMQVVLPLRNVEASERAANLGAASVS